MRRRKTLPKKSGWYWHDSTLGSSTEWKPAHVYWSRGRGLVYLTWNSDFEKLLSNAFPMDFGPKIKK